MFSAVDSVNQQTRRRAQSSWRHSCKDTLIWQSSEPAAPHVRPVITLEGRSHLDSKSKYLGQLGLSPIWYERQISVFNQVGQGYTAINFRAVSEPLDFYSPCKQPILVPLEIARMECWKSVIMKENSSLRSAISRVNTNRPPHQSTCSTPRN